MTVARRSSEGLGTGRSTGRSRRPDFARDQRRLLYKHLIWPMAAVAVNGLTGYLLLPEIHQSIWLTGSLLTLAGAFLSVQWAAVLGGLAFLSALSWLFVEQHLYGISGGVFMAFALLPFAPIWLAAARSQQLESARLHRLLELPQIRATMTVSDWSLLPTPRAIDRRLRQHLAEAERSGTKDPALVFRLHFRSLARASDLLGEGEVRLLMLRLADSLRGLVRMGDVLAEDIRERGILYLLVFPDPEHPGSEAALARRLRPVLTSSGLSGWRLQVAAIPRDGQRVHALKWREPDR